MKLIQSALCICLLAPALAWADVSEEVEYNFAVDSGASFKLENINGDIEISAWDQSSIAVRAIKSADDQETLDRIQIIVDTDAKQVSIDTKHDKGKSGWFNWSNGDKGKVHYIVQAPRDIVLRLVDTVNGDLDITGIAGDVKAETVNGDIEVQGLGGDADVETVNGDITARFDQFSGNQSGSFDTVNGRVTVYLPANASASIDADTVNGSIKNDFGLNVEKSFASRELHGDIGGGGGRLSFDTVNGSVNIRSQ